MPFFGGATPVKFDPRSLALLGQANPVLAQILRETERRAADRGITLGVGEVKRSPERQAEMVVTGKSQTYNSRHLNGSAADLVIKGPDGKPNWDFEAYRPVAAIAKEVAAEQGVPDFVWGGDWKTLKDGVHFQVGGPVKGNQAGKDTPTRGLGIAPGGETDKLQTGGLLSRILPQENGQSAFWNKVPGLSDPDKRAKLALALDGMTLNPNQGLQKGLVADIEGRAQTKQRNATAEWLRSQGNEELAAAVEAGSLAGDQAIGLHYEQRKPAAPVELQHFTGPDGLEYSYNPMTGETAPLNTGAPIPKEPATSDDIREYEYAKREAAAQGKPPPPPFSEWLDARRAAGASKSTVNVGGEGIPGIGTIPQGYSVVADPKEPSGYRMVPIGGGPEDKTRSDAAAVDAAKITADTVMRAAERARTAASERVVGGLAGQLASNLPGSANAEVYRQVDVLKANAKVSSLNAMRAASPTGGALGNVTEREGQMLADMAGALDPASPNFERDLADYTRTLLMVVHGPEYGQKLFEQSWSPQAPAVSDDDLFKKYGIGQ
jgi:hypothetical protein